MLPQQNAKGAHESRFSIAMLVVSSYLRSCSQPHRGAKGWPYTTQSTRTWGRILLPDIIIIRVSPPSEQSVCRCGEEKKKRPPALRTPHTSSSRWNNPTAICSVARRCERHRQGEEERVGILHHINKTDRWDQSRKIPPRGRQRTAVYQVDIVNRAGFRRALDKILSTPPLFGFNILHPCSVLYYCGVSSVGNRRRHPCATCGRYKVRRR